MFSWILLDSKCSSTIIMRIFIPEKNMPVTQCQTQAGNLTTNKKVKIDFTLPEFSAEKKLMWNFHVEDSAKVFMI